MFRMTLRILAGICLVLVVQSLFVSVAYGSQQLYFRYDSSGFEYQQTNSTTILGWEFGWEYGIQPFWESWFWTSLRDHPLHAKLVLDEHFIQVSIPFWILF